jgi:hypothetical protein
MRRRIGRALRKSYGRTVADVWKITERRTSKAATKQLFGRCPVSKVFLSIINTAVGTLIGALFVFAAITL